MSEMETVVVGSIQAFLEKFLCNTFLSATLVVRLNSHSDILV